MKRITLAVLVCIFLTLPTFAENHVAEIAIDAEIYKDGSMYITQVWDGEFSEGTENYIPMKAPEYLTISNLTVTDINGTYQTLEQWDIDADFEEKANKCGINYTDSGYEICFGISEYGKNRYAIEYKLENVVGGYNDMDGVNFRFVNDEMNTTPTDVKVSIHLADGTPITDEIADIWAFGFEGQVEFSDGGIIAYTETPIESNGHVTVMFGLNKGIISPARVEDESFENIKEKAFDGSDYDDSPSGTEVLLMVLTFIVLPIILIAGAAFWSNRMKRIKMQKFVERFGYFRDIPNEGNTNATYELGRLFEVCSDGAILATGMLKLIDLGYLEPMSEEKVGFMGKVKETVNLRITHNNRGKRDQYDEYLCTILEGAAGEDGILQAKELESFADKNDKLLRKYIKKCESAGKNYLNQKQCLTCQDSPSKLKYLTPSGEKELGELLGFKKYLEDFSLIAERGVDEMPIWKELLSYAMLFGIADKVSEQMKELYPNIAAEVTCYTNDLTVAYSYHYLLYNNMRNAELRREQEKRSSGSGGSSSFGGGGGSIGGGSGGGSR